MLECNVRVNTGQSLKASTVLIFIGGTVQSFIGSFAAIYYIGRNWSVRTFYNHPDLSILPVQNIEIDQ